MLPKEPGTYGAVPLIWAVKDRGEQPPEFCIEFSLKAQFDFDTEKWVSLPPDVTITGYFYPWKNESNTPTPRYVPNGACRKQLTDALNWMPSVDFCASFQDADLSKTKLQLVIEEEEYKGKKSLKVKWLNSANAIPGRGKTVTKAEPALLKSLDSKWGKMRGFSDAQPVRSPAPAGVPQENTPFEDLSISEESIPF